MNKAIIAIAAKKRVISQTAVQRVGPVVAGQFVIVRAAAELEDFSVNLLAPLLKELCENTRLPVIAKPNAGLPDPVDGHYDMGPEDFAQALLTCVEAGISIVGGCCGTSPEYIRRLTAVLEGKKPVSRHYNNTGLDRKSVV